MRLPLPFSLPIFFLRLKNACWLIPNLGKPAAQLRSIPRSGDQRGAEKFADGQVSLRQSPIETGHALVHPVGRSDSRRDFQFPHWRPSPRPLPASCRAQDEPGTCAWHFRHGSSLPAHPYIHRFATPRAWRQPTPASSAPRQRKCSSRLPLSPDWGRACARLRPELVALERSNDPAVWTRPARTFSVRKRARASEALHFAFVAWSKRVGLRNLSRSTAFARPRNTSPGGRG